MDMRHIEIPAPTPVIMRKPKAVLADHWGTLDSMATIRFISIREARSTLVAISSLEFNPTPVAAAQSSLLGSCPNWRVVMM